MTTAQAANIPKADNGIKGDDAVARNATHVVKDVVSIADAARLYV